MQIYNVCNSLEEATLLYRAISDFSVDGSREKYAKWLDSQDAPERAEAVRRTIHAFQNFDASSLDKMGGSIQWQGMIAAPLLSTFINGAEKFDRDAMIVFRDVIFLKLKPALSLAYQLAETDLSLGSSRLWGLPDLPVSLDWPKIAMASNWFDAREDLPQDKHCAFLGQFSFADFKRTILGQEMPKDGGFSIFSITEVNKLGITETVIIPWLNGSEISRREPPPDLLDDKLGDGANSPYPEHEVVLHERLSLPDATWGPFGQIIPNCGWGEPYHDFYSELLSICGENRLGFGGYLRHTSGEDPSPDTNAIRLAVLRATPDAGVVHFAIPSTDLQIGRLDRVEYVWNDWDS